MRFIFPSIALVAGLLLAAFLIVEAGGTASAQQESVTVTMAAATGPQGGGSQTGTVTLTANGSQTDISVDIQPGVAADDPQPIHIHSGNCDNLPTSLGSIAHDLTNGGTDGVVAGKMTATVNATLASLQTGDFAINVHKSGAELGVYVACGNIPAASTGATTVPSTGGAPPSGGPQTQTYLLLAAGALAILGSGSLAFALRRQR